jgi:hypothetical protein
MSYFDPEYPEDKRCQVCHRAETEKERLIPRAAIAPGVGPPPAWVCRQCFDQSVPEREAWYWHGSLGMMSGGTGFIHRTPEEQANLRRMIRHYRLMKIRHGLGIGVWVVGAIVFFLWFSNAWLIWPATTREYVLENYIVPALICFFIAFLVTRAALRRSQ